MKTFICILVLAAAVNAGLIHHAPLPLSSGLALSGGLSSGLALGGGLSHGLALSGGHQLIKVIHQEPAPLLIPAPVQHSAQLIKVIHQHAAPAPAPILLHTVPVVHTAPIVHHAPASLKIIKVLHQAPTGW